LSERVGQQLLDGDAVGLRLEAEHDAMPQHRLGEGEDILRRDVESALAHRADFRGKDECLSRARAGAVAHIFFHLGAGQRGFRMGAHDHVHDPLADRRRNRHAAREGAERDEA